MASGIGRFRHLPAVVFLLFMILLYYGHIELSIDTFYNLYVPIDIIICALYLWTHIFTDDIILL